MDVSEIKKIVSNDGNVSIVYNADDTNTALISFGDLQSREVPKDKVEQLLKLIGVDLTNAVSATMKFHFDIRNVGVGYTITYRADNDVCCYVKEKDVVNVQIPPFSAFVNRNGVGEDQIDSADFKSHVVMKESDASDDPVALLKQYTIIKHFFHGIMKDLVYSNYDYALIYCYKDDNDKPLVKINYYIAKGGCYKKSDHTTLWYEEHDNFMSILLSL